MDFSKNVYRAVSRIDDVSRFYMVIQRMPLVFAALNMHFEYVNARTARQLGNMWCV